MLRRLVAQAQLGCCVVADSVVDLVADESRAMVVAPARDGRELVRRHHRPGRVGRTRENEASGRCIERIELRDRQLETGFRPAGHGQHRAAERGENVPVRRVAGLRDDDNVARFERREEGEEERPRRAGRCRDVAGLHVDAVGAPIMRGDRIAQDRQTQRAGIANAVLLQHQVRLGSHLAPEPASKAGLR